MSNSQHRLTFDVSVHYPSIVKEVDSPYNITSVMTYYLLSETLPGNAPHCPFSTQLHEHEQVTLRVERGLVIAHSLRYRSLGTHMMSLYSVELDNVFVF